MTSLDPLPVDRVYPALVRAEGALREITGTLYDHPEVVSEIAIHHTGRQLHLLLGLLHETTALVSSGDTPAAAAFDDLRARLHTAILATS